MVCFNKLDEAKVEDAVISEGSEMIGACFDDRMLD